MLSRRGFLKTIVGGIATAAVAPFLPKLAKAPALDAPLTGSSLTVSNLSAAETFQVGDIFTIAGRYAMNPQTRRYTDQPQVFMVTAVTSDGITASSPSLPTSETRKAKPVRWNPPLGRNDRSRFQRRFN